MERPDPHCIWPEMHLLSLVESAPCSPIPQRSPLSVVFSSGASTRGFSFRFRSPLIHCIFIFFKSGSCKF
ncbi:hypothetical protein S83_035702 [Arachis hypogaea]